jgi:hypothetical protein
MAWGNALKSLGRQRVQTFLYERFLPVPPCVTEQSASWYDAAPLLRLGRVDHHELVTVRHLHLRQRLRIHHVLGPDDAVEVQEIRRHGVYFLVGQ